ncbi:unnamed protein product, partial [Prorocentrum cordatum]
MARAGHASWRLVRSLTAAPAVRRAAGSSGLPAGICTLLLPARRAAVLCVGRPGAGSRCIGATACSRGIEDDELRQRLHDFNEQFAEARLCLSDASESKDTTYFADDIEEAKEAVDKTVELYESLLSALGEEKRAEVESANSLKVRSFMEE